MYGASTHTYLFDKVESKAFRLISSSPLTECLQPLSTAGMLRLLLFSIAIFMLTALLFLLSACLFSSWGLTAQGFILLISIQSISLVQELTSTFCHSYLSMVNSETLSTSVFSSFDHDFTLFKREVSRRLSSPSFWLLYGDWHLSGPLFCFNLSLGSFLSLHKKLSATSVGPAQDWHTTCLIVFLPLVR